MGTSCFVCDRCKDTVKHYNIYWDGKHYKFGMAIFDNLQEFMEHFVNRPLVAGESGKSSDLYKGILIIK